MNPLIELTDLQYFLFSVLFVVNDQIRLMPTAVLRRRIAMKTRGGFVTRWHCAGTFRSTHQIFMGITAQVFGLLGDTRA